MLPSLLPSSRLVPHESFRSPRRLLSSKTPFSVNIPRQLLLLCTFVPLLLVYIPSSKRDSRTHIFDDPLLSRNDRSIFHQMLSEIDGGLQGRERKKRSSPFIHISLKLSKAKERERAAGRTRGSELTIGPLFLIAARAARVRSLLDVAAAAAADGGGRGEDMTFVVR